MKLSILAITLLVALAASGCAGGLAETGGSTGAIGYDADVSPAQRQALAEERAYDARIDAMRRTGSDPVAWPTAHG